MNDAFSKLFTPYLKLDADGMASTSDGRPLSPTSQGYEIAERLFETNAKAYADEIIKLMKPYCLRFDIAAMRAAIITAARKSGEARQAVRASSQAQSAG